MKNTNTEIGTEAVKLRRAVQQHQADGCAAVNTLFAVFGVASPQGRLVDKFSFMNAPYAMWLGDLAYDLGHQVSRDREEVSSDAAKAMVVHGLCRGRGRSGGNRRRVAMTEAARNALLAYYAEKLRLIASVGDLLTRAGALHSNRRSFIRRHAKACERLCQSL
jgi:hypothetical protein